MNPLKVVIVACAALLVGLVVALLIVKSSIQGWLKSDDFRQMMVSKSSAALQSEVELEELKWQGAEVYSDRFVARGYEGASFSQLSLDGVRAKTGGIRAGAFRVPDASANRFLLKFSPKRITAPVGEVLEPRTGATAPDVPEWARRFLPHRLELDEFRLSSASVKVEQADGRVPFLLNNTQATIWPDFQTEIWEIRGKGGNIVVPDQPEIRIKDLAMRWRGEHLFVDRCGLGIYADGHVDGTGEIEFGEEGEFDLDLELSSIKVDEIVGEEWRKRIDGIVGGPVRITGRPGAFVYEGSINVSDAVVEAMPVLQMIAKYTRNDRFERLVLSRARTDFRHEGDRVRLTGLELQSDGLVRIEGEVDIVAGILDGQLQVGVAPGTLRWIPGAERQVFVQERDGYLWAAVTLAGTVAEPKEDLSGRLIAAAGEELLQGLPAGVLNEAKKLLGTDSEDIESGDTLLDTGKPIIDLISPFLKGL